MSDLLKWRKREEELSLQFKQKLADLGVTFVEGVNHPETKALYDEICQLNQRITRNMRQLGKRETTRQIIVELAAKVDQVLERAQGEIDAYIDANSVLQARKATVTFKFVCRGVNLKPDHTEPVLMHTRNGRMFTEVVANAQPNLLRLQMAYPGQKDELQALLKPDERTLADRRRELVKTHGENTPLITFPDGSQLVLKIRGRERGKEV